MQVKGKVTKVIFENEYFKKVIFEINEREAVIVNIDNDIYKEFAPGEEVTAKIYFKVKEKNDILYQVAVLKEVKSE